MLLVDQLRLARQRGLRRPRSMPRASRSAGIGSTRVRPLPQPRSTVGAPGIVWRVIAVVVSGGGSTSSSWIALGFVTDASLRADGPEAPRAPRALDSRLMSARRRACGEMGVGANWVNIAGVLDRAPGSVCGA